MKHKSSCDIVAPWSLVGVVHCVLQNSSIMALYAGILSHPSAFMLSVDIAKLPPGGATLSPHAACLPVGDTKTHDDER